MGVVEEVCKGCYWGLVENFVDWRDKCDVVVVVVVGFVVLIFLFGF